MLTNYFKERPGFKRLFENIKKKYVSLGRYSGIIKLENITKEEARDFTDFFGVQYKEGKTIKVSFRQIEKVLENTKYHDFTWEELLKDYFGKEIKDNKTKKEEKKQEIEFFFERVKHNLNEEEQIFLEKVRQDKTLSFLLLKRYKKDAKQFEEDLKWLIKLVENIECHTPTTLPVFASITKNPHFLDFKTSNMSLFIKLLSYKLQKEEPKTTIEKINFLNEIGISIDQVSNFVITYKLQSNSKLVQTFYEEDEILNINLSNMEKIKDLDTCEKKVFVFENPSLLNELKKLKLPIIITSGNANFCVFKVLELLNQSGNTIYYNGDFDPEGLLNAEKLKNHFPNIKLFCYTKKDYENTKSQEKISEARCNKLSKVKSFELTEIKKLLKENRVAGYQEKNQNNIEEFIKSVLQSDEKI